MNRKNAMDFSNLSNYDESYMPGSGRYNVGETSNLILMPMLKNALNQIIEWDPRRIQAYCKTLIKPLLEFTSKVNIAIEQDEYFCNHLFTLKLPKTIAPEKLKLNLEKENIFLSKRGENLRTSVNVYNDSNDIDKLIYTIDKTIKE